MYTIKQFTVSGAASRHTLLHTHTHTLSNYLIREGMGGGRVGGLPLLVTCCLLSGGANLLMEN